MKETILLLAMMSIKYKRNEMEKCTAEHEQKSDKILFYSLLKTF